MRKGASKIAMVVFCSAGLCSARRSARLLADRSFNCTSSRVHAQGFARVENFNIRRENIMNGLREAVAIAAMAGSLCVAGLANADESQAAPTPAAATEMNSLRVVVDKNTGKVRAPTEEELAALIAAQNAAKQNAAQARTARAAGAARAPMIMPATKTVQRHANGMVSARMSANTLSALKVEHDAQGNAHLVHASEAQPTAVEE
jgi:hypothetical protein